MSPRTLYQDDAALTNFLDGLIESAKENESRTNVTPAEVLTRTDTNVSFTSKQLHTGIQVANQYLLDGAQCPPLPALGEHNEKMEDVLAAALTAIVRLSRCCKANANLRTEAENATQASQAQVQRLSRSLKESREKLSKKESSLIDMRKKMAEMDIKAKGKIRQLTLDCTNYKNRLASAMHRENHLVLEASQRERQFAQLQKRVHSLMSSTKKLSIEPVITGTAARLRHSRQRNGTSGDNDDVEVNGEQTESNVEEEHYCEAGPAVTLLDENHFMRSTVRAIHNELDDMLDSFPSAFSFLNGAEDEKEEMPPCAPSEERMLLPCEMIKEEFEGNLERKLQVIRKALEAVE